MTRVPLRSKPRRNAVERVLPHCGTNPPSPVTRATTRRRSYLAARAGRVVLRVTEGAAIALGSQSAPSKEWTVIGMGEQARAGIYCRISSDRSGEAAGVARQESDCRALAAREGWSVAEVYVDNDVSAYSGKSRPAWTRLLADAGEGRIDVIAAWHDDRLWRNVVEQQVVFGLCRDAGVRTVATPARIYDTASSDDDFLSGIQALVAQKESADKARRVRRKHDQLAAEGKPGGGIRPFGYGADHVTIVPEEAALIREAAIRVLAGEGVWTVCNDWNERGLTTSLGRVWRNRALKNILVSPRIAGLREHRGQVVGPAVWEAIIDRQAHERLRMLLLDASRRRSGPKRRYLLSGGLTECGRCGSALVAQPRQDKTRTYACVKGLPHGGCGRLRCVAEPLEDLVRDAVLGALDGPGLVAALSAVTDGDEEAARLMDDLRRLEERLDELARSYADGLVDLRSWSVARERLEQNASAARGKVRRLHRARVLLDLPADLRGAWDEHDVNWRRALLDAVLLRVVVHRSHVTGHFDPHRVKLLWRA